MASILRILFKPFRTSIAFKLGITLLFGTLLVFWIVFAYNNHNARKFIQEEARQSAKQIARHTISEIDSYLLKAETLPRFLAKQLEWDHHDYNQLGEMLENAILIQPSVYGSAIAFEPYNFSPKKDLCAIYAYRDGHDIRIIDLAKSYNYLSQDWYSIPKKKNSTFWSEPYFDDGGGNTLMSTFSVPFYREKDGKKSFAGVVTSDMQISHLCSVVSSLHIYQTGFSFLLSPKGIFISHPNSQYVGTESLSTLAKKMKSSDMQKLADEISAGHEGLLYMPAMLQDRPAWVYFRPLPSCNWYIGIVFPEDEVLASIRKLNKDIMVIAAIGLLALLAIIVLLSDRITRPIRVLSEETTEISKGNLEHPFTLFPSADEVGKLTSSFENMRLSLKEYIGNLTQATAVKERIEREIQIAKEIQTSLLPHIFPAYPERDEFDLHACMEPARDVGGDFYDYYLLDNTKLYFVVGDVSGKGIPAALFMAVSKTLLKATACTASIPPHEILQRVNAEICSENESYKFVTMFFGVLDLQTGLVEYCNAGHNHPVIIRKNSHSEILEVVTGIPVGIKGDYHYSTQAFTLNKGESLLLYTDGVTEARNHLGDFFGDESLLKSLSNMPQANPKEICTTIMEKVQAFAAKCPQSDDITLFSIRYIG